MRGARKSPPEYFGISRDEVTIAPRRADDPDAGDEVRAIAANGDREIIRGRHLPVEGAGSGADVPERVPRLFHEQSPPCVVADEDIDRPEWLVGSDGKLERPKTAGRPRQAEEHLLDRQMACIDRRLLPVAGEFEPRSKAELVRQLEPRLEADPSTVAKLDSARLALADPDQSPELRLGQPTADPGRSNRRPETADDLVRFSLELEPACRSATSATLDDHGRMLTEGSSRSLIHG
jgi:hypothetical protein